MAGDWIKMRACLASDPKVIAIGRHLETHSQFSRWVTCGQYDDAVTCDVALRYVVTGALHNVWCNANEHCNGDVVSNADLLWIDAVAGIQNFGVAMQSVGWVEIVDGGLRFPKFNSHNTSAAERQKRYRQRRALQSDVTRDVTRNVAVTSKRREEKIREEKSLGEVSPKTPLRTRSKAPKAAATNYPEAFGVFWEAFPPGRRTDKPKASESWQRALQMIAGRDGISSETAAEQWLAQRAADYAASDQGRGAYVRMPSTWLNQQGYDDPPEAWADKNGKPVVKIESPNERAARMARDWEAQHGTDAN